MKRKVIALMVMAAVFSLPHAVSAQYKPQAQPQAPVQINDGALKTKKVFKPGGIFNHTLKTAASGTRPKTVSTMATDVGVQLTPSGDGVFRFITDWSWDGKWITYSQDGDIYIIPAAGGDPINLTNVQNGECFAPSFSPDSNSVIFSWWDGVNITSSEVDAINITTRQVLLLYDLAALGVMSRDGKYFVFRSTAGDLCVYDTTVNSLNVINSGDQAYGYIAISPDNKNVVTTMYTKDGYERLFGIPLAGGTPVQLTFHSGAQYYPEFSPDGKWLLYTDWDDKTSTSQIRALDLTTGTPDFIWDTAVDAWCASFAPGGKRFAYLKYNEDADSYDLYAADFPFAAATPLKVVTPNGGETWPAGTTQIIKWEGPANAKVEYSIDSGSTWTALPVPATALANRYEWVVPNTPSTKCLVRVSALTGSVTDVSDAVFSIVKPLDTTLTLTYPNGGQSFKVGSIENITWKSSGVTNIKIDYSTDSGTTWVTIISNTSAAAGTFLWTVPDVESSACLVKITDISNATLADKSDGTFEIWKPAIFVTAPNGGNVWGVGATETITWEAGGVDAFTIEYSTDAGTTWAKIASPVPVAMTNTYKWTIPNTPSEKCLLRISDASNPKIFDISDMPFTISTAPVSVIEVTAPNGGESFTAGTSYDITWISSGVANVKIEYSTDRGTTWMTIAATVENRGVYAWFVPANVSSTKCLVRVSSASDSTVVDVSDTVFSIVSNSAIQKITVTSPNGGESWTAGSTVNITWASTAVAGVKLEYSTDNGSTWTVIMASTAATTGTYAWTIPATVNSTRCIVRASAAVNAAVMDVSDAMFTIAPATSTPRITVTAPNGGEKINAGSNYTITWTAENVTNFNVEYSSDGGATWTYITLASVNNAARTCAWVVPDAVSDKYIVRVSDATNAAVNDKSDAVFSVVTQMKITITAPNGGEIWQSGSSQTIRWTSTGISYVNIEFSPDGGQGWTIVAENVNSSTGTGSYPFTSPAIVSTDCLMRVTSTKNANVSDVSDAPFTVKPAPFIKITSPVGGETWGAGTLNQIIFKAFGPKSLTFEYSVDNGVTWTTIAEKIDITTVKVVSAPTESIKEYSFGWKLPNLAARSEKCFVRITDGDDNLLRDRSAATFIITPNVAVTLTSPTGGEVLFAGAQTTITWTSSATVTALNIQLSTDSGATWNAIATNVKASNGSYPWTVPNINAATCRVKLIDTATSASSASARDFTIKPPSVTVTSPNGGEVIESGSVFSITWKAEGVDRISILYTTDGGNNYTVIESSVDAATGSYRWNVPSVSSTSCAVAVMSTTVSSITDVSDATFTIKSNTWITVLEPNGGEKFYAGQTVNIRWRSQNVSLVDIIFTPGDVGSAVYVAQYVSASLGSFEWEVPDSLTTKGVIVVIDSSNNEIYDGNDDFFTILQPSITLNYPVGGETLKTGDKVTINWQSTGLQFLNITYSTDDFWTWDYVGQDVDATQGTFDWIVPDLNSTTVQIAIGTGYAYAVSDHFTVAKGTKPYLQLTAPNGGDTWIAGSSQIIRWSASNSSSLKIEYTTDGGTTWNLTASDVKSSNGSYSWTVPNAPSQNCRIRITDLTDTTVSDASDAIFSIVESTAAFISVTSPGAGERLTVGSKRDIKWEFSGVSSVKIELSTDNGATWETVVENPPAAASGSYQWTVPDKKSKQCMLRISDMNKPAVEGKSGTFEIAQPEIVVAHTPITQAKENDRITFSAEVTGAANLVVELRYDVTGRRVFDKTMTMAKGEGSTYSCSIDVGVFTAEGMEYAIVARDPDNVSLRTTSPDQGYYCIRAQVKDMVSPYSVTGGSEQNAYRMISIPLQLTKSYITDQLERLPEGSSGPDWRLFRFSPGETEPREYPNIEGFSPGIAFWLIATKSFQLKTPEGVAVTTSEPFTIELKPGWNDIANPWMFDISWNDIENPSSANISKPYAYEGGWSNPAAVGTRILSPWTGYAVKNMESRNVIIRLVPKHAVSVQKEAFLDADLVWKLSIAARAGLASDTANDFGVRKSASTVWDDNDHVEPPAIGRYVTVTFPHRDWARYPSDYTIDFRPPESDLSWDFDVRTNIVNEVVSVAIDGITKLPAGVSFALIDRDTGKTVDCTGGAFSFVSGGGLTERRYTLTVNGAGTPGHDTDVRPAAFVTTRAYPNPFNPRTVIRYELSGPGDVVLSVFNTVGQIVRQERLGRKERGVYEYVFDASRLTSGLYVYRVDAGYSSATDKMLYMK